MWKNYKTNKRIKKIAIELDEYIKKTYPEIRMEFRSYYLSYFINGRVILYIWIYSNNLGIFFKDEDNLLKSTSNKIPKGITTGFNKIYRVNNNTNKIKKSKSIIKKYFNLYF